VSAIPLTLGVVLLALLCCFGRAGVARLAELRLGGGMCALLSLLAQALGVATQQHRFELLLIAAVLLGLFCWSNRRQAGIALISTGIALNMLVMAANGGTMPINAASLDRLGIYDLQGPDLPLQKSRVAEDTTARFAWLGDRLHLPGPLASLAAWSIGDIVLISGVSWMLWHTMKGSSHVLQTPRRRAPLPGA